MPQKRKKKERRERLRGERDQIKFIDLRFETFAPFPTVPSSIAREQTGKSVSSSPCS